jgi:hypothetical protein
VKDMVHLTHVRFQISAPPSIVYCVIFLPLEVEEESDGWSVGGVQ